MSALHVAARVEDGFHRRLIPYLRERGWRPKVIAYVGYGNDQVVRVLARVILSRGHDADESRRMTALDLIERRGWRSYVSAPVSFIPVTVRVGDQVVSTVTDRSGYVDLVVNGHDLPSGWHGVEIHAKAAEPAHARVRIIGTEPALGIVSDIDDTALVTLVPRPFIALWNTFVRQGSARHVVPGMAQMYRELIAEYPDAPLFYLSTGAWNIMPTLAQFLRSHFFPAGPMLMTDWGPTNTGWFRSGQEHKRVALRRLAAEFPNVRWVLIGDDGQYDPMIYREFAREYPNRVAAIAIRQLSPREQVLAHGTPVPTVEPGEYRGQPAAPEVTGEDGFDMAPLLFQALRPDAD